MTDAPTKLDQWMAGSPDRTDTWLAARIGRDRSFITRVRRGEVGVSIETAVAIEDATGGEVTVRDLARLRLPPSDAQPERLAS